jgi:hypothetical protein
MNTNKIKIIEIEFEYFTREGVEGCKSCLNEFETPHFNCVWANNPRTAIGHNKTGHCHAGSCA